MIFPLHERRTFRVPSRFASQVVRVISALLDRRGWIVVAQSLEPDGSVLLTVEDVRSLLE